MGYTDLAESDSPSDVDEQTKAWESDPRSVRAQLAETDSVNDPISQVECVIGHRVQASRSVLALVVDEDCVFAGLQGGDIVVCGQHHHLIQDINVSQAWSLDNYDLVLSVRAHQESVLDLFLSEDGDLLFSSGGDSVVNVPTSMLHSSPPLTGCRFGLLALLNDYIPFIPIMMSGIYSLSRTLPA